MQTTQLVTFTERFGPLFVHAQTSLLTTYKRQAAYDLLAPVYGWLTEDLTQLSPS